MNLNIGNIGVWGFRHYKFLKQNRPATVGVMRMNGKNRVLPPRLTASDYRDPYPFPPVAFRAVTVLRVSH